MTLNFKDIQDELVVIMPDFASRYKSGIDCNDLVNEVLLFPNRFLPGVFQDESDGILPVDRVGMSTCQFNLDIFYSMQQFPSSYKYKINTTLWLCELETSKICDGISQCATDECHCLAKTSAPYFFCFDGSGCISSGKVCDDKQHCKDGSDECFCPASVKLSCPDTLSQNEICISPGNYWQLQKSARFSDCSIKNEPAKVQMDINWGMYKNPIRKCLKVNDFPTHPINDRYISTFCKRNCSNIEGFAEGNWSYFCDQLISAGFFTYYRMDYVFFCEKSDRWGAWVSISVICDGTLDCQNGADEFGCPNRFYCTNLTWIENVRVCDHVKDCANGADECGTCDFGAVSSSTFLIHSKVILAVTIVLGASMVILNIYEGHKCYVGETSTKVGEIDRLLRLQIFFYDWSMGVYLGCIVLAAVVLKFKGDYCLHEREWRASAYCSTLGVLFSFSSHGSLIVVACVSVVRCITCTTSIGNNCRKKTVVVVSVIMYLINTAHSILPVLPHAFIQDFFRTEIYFSNIWENPFFNINPINVSHLNQMYRGKFNHVTDIYTTLAGLRNVTSNPEIFDTMEISYYGNSALCVHNIFKAEASYKVYMVTYCVVLVILLITVLVTYSRIVWIEKKSKARLAGAVAGAVAGNQHVDALTLKVALMIGTQLMGWIPLIFTAIYFQFMTSSPAPPMVFEVFALVVIPINSFLNPVFYSELYKKFLSHVGVCWGWFVEKVTGCFQNTECEVEGIEMAVLNGCEVEGIEMAPANKCEVEGIEMAPANESDVEGIEIAPANECEVEGIEMAPANESEVEGIEMAPANECEVEGITMAPANECEVEGIEMAPAKECEVEGIEMAPANESEVEGIEMAPANEYEVEGIEMAPANECEVEGIEIAPANESEVEGIEMAPANEYEVEGIEMAPANESEVEGITMAPANECEVEGITMAPANECEVEGIEMAPTNECEVEGIEMAPANESDVEGIEIAPANECEVEGIEMAPANESEVEGIEMAPANESEVEGITMAPANKCEVEGIEMAPANESDVEGIEIAPANKCEVEGIEMAPANESDVEGIEIAPANECEVEGIEMAPANECEVEGIEMAPANESEVEGIAMTPANECEVEGIEMAPTNECEVEGIEMAPANESDVEGIEIAPANECEVEGIEMAPANECEVEGIEIAPANECEVEGIEMASANESEVEGIEMAPANLQMSVKLKVLR